MITSFALFRLATSTSLLMKFLTMTLTKNSLEAFLLKAKFYDFTNLQTTESQMTLT